MTARERERRLPRWSLTAVCLPLAAIYAWAAFTLPWADWSFFAIAHGALAALHLATGLAAAYAWRRLALIWRLQSVLALAHLVYLGWGILSSAWYVRSVYAGLGDGVAAALAAVFGLVVLLILPLSLWGIAATGGVRLGRAGAAALVFVVGLAGLRLALIGAEVRGTSLASEAQATAFAAELATIEVRSLPPARRSVPLADAAPAPCAAPPAVGTLTAIVAFAQEKAPAVRCLQASDPETLVAAIADLLKREARRGFVKVDLVTERLPLAASIPLLESLALRPGLDGACHTTRCLAPWQLVVLEAFTRHAPIPSVPDARLGAALQTIRERLGGPFDRIATRGFLLSPQGMVELGRTPGPPTVVDAESVGRAEAAAWRYVRRSQGTDGRFRYLVDPFTGRVVSNDRSIARQAGTTLALCELAPEGKAARAVILRSLDHLAGLERRFTLGDHEAGILRDDPRSAEPRERVGPSALSLAALLRCRDRVGDRYDPLIARLGRTLTGAQRPDGGFHHQIDLDRGAPIAGRGSIFVDGQIVLALTLLEARDPSLHGAVEAAMTHFGGPYWDGFLRPLLFLEENWHCIAAAAALPIHRHDGYERFCLDYVTMKGRIIHEPDDDVHPDFLGGYGFGNLVPPHNTATAGYGEALAAALEIMEARGMDRAREEARMRLVMAFLMRNQRLADHCYACAPVAFGGFSEHMASPLVRIDYVQHAWAAMGHGARALGLR